MNDKCPEAEARKPVTVIPVWPGYVEVRWPGGGYIVPPEYVEPILDRMRGDR